MMPSYIFVSMELLARAELATLRLIAGRCHIISKMKV